VVDQDVAHAARGSAGSNHGNGFWMKDRVQGVLDLHRRFRKLARLGKRWFCYLPPSVRRGNHRSKCGGNENFCQSGSASVLNFMIWRSKAVRQRRSRKSANPEIQEKTGRSYASYL